MYFYTIKKNEEHSSFQVIFHGVSNKENSPKITKNRY